MILKLYPWHEASFSCVFFNVIIQKCGINGGGVFLSNHNISCCFAKRGGFARNFNGAFLDSLWLGF